MKAKMSQRARDIIYDPKKLKKLQSAINFYRDSERARGDGTNSKNVITINRKKYKLSKVHGVTK